VGGAHGGDGGGEEDRAGHATAQIIGTHTWSG
jgi:hypothetical protein